MPSRRAPKLCGEPGCDNVQPCPIHKPAARMHEYNRRPERRTQKAFYSSPEWLRARAAHLARYPVCQCDPECCPKGCARPGTDVDHIRQRPRGAPFDARGIDADDNLQSLAAVPCHRRKTMRETNARRRAAL